MGDGRIFLKNLRDTSFNKDLSNEPTFGRIHLAGSFKLRRTQYDELRHTLSKLQYKHSKLLYAAPSLRYDCTLFELRRT